MHEGCHASPSVPTCTRPVPRSHARARLVRPRGSPQRCAAEEDEMVGRARPPPPSRAQAPPANIEPQVGNG